MPELERLLADGLTAAGIAATAEQKGRLLHFVRLLAKWNRVYNLTSIKAPIDMVRLHLLDSLAILPLLRGGRVLDVGTGAGLPGIPLATLATDIRFVLLDSNAKKTRFVQQAVIEMGLANVAVETARIEEYRPQNGFDVIICRAFASLPVIVEQTSRLLNPGGVILAQKGKLPEDEIQQLTGVRVESVPLTVPGVDAERHLIAITTAA